MTQICWLASYPKSGNTWLRVFLANALNRTQSPYDINALRDFGGSDLRASLYERAAAKPLAELDDRALHRLRPAVHRFLATRGPGIVFVKTHNAIAVLDGVPTITPEVTAGAIYVVRNPLDVAVSYAHHFGLDLDAAVAVLCAAGNRLVTHDQTVGSLLDSWGRHVTSWSTASGLAAHVVRYEDLLVKPVPSFRAVLAYLKLERSHEELKRAVRFASFKELERQEACDGFVEQALPDRRFFRAGRAGEWRKRLNPAQVERIVEVNGTVMDRYGYLP
jgi:Sulfotransferase domain